MVFSSLVFLFGFLPCALLIHFLAPRPYKNLVLLLTSFAFYSFGSLPHLVVLLVSTIVNYCLAILVARNRRLIAQLYLYAALVFNLGLLCYFKYLSFIVENINIVFKAFAVQPVSLNEIALPIGISFYTFQALSYVIDVYRGRVKATSNLIEVALYISLFPQLIAGPIVRYIKVAHQLRSRMITIVGFNYGIKRFIYGLSKKVILANIFGEVCDQIFAISPSQLAGSVAWLGIICYSLQIYFDFSGYSDMAIGLGRLLGFRYPENFRHPYISQSIQEFWRRWHISLSTWFRDYLYIPLGGNRKGPIRTCLNLMLVFCLCGLWHGASWNFLIWGIIHGIFLSVERFAGGAEKIIMWRPLRHTYAMAVVMLGWVFFRVETLPDAYQYLAAMCNSSTKGMAFVELGDFVTAELIVCLIAGIFCSTPLLVKLRRTLRRRQVRFVRVNVWPIIEICLNGALFLLTLACLVARTHNPFIYFRF